MVLVHFRSNMKVNKTQREQTEQLIHDSTCKTFHLMSINITRMPARAHGYSPTRSLTKQCCSPPPLEVRCLARRLSISHAGCPAYLKQLRSLKVVLSSTTNPNHSVRLAAWRTVVTGMWNWGFFLIPAPHVGPLLAFCTELMSLHAVSRMSYSCCMLHFLWIS